MTHLDPRTFVPPANAFGEVHAWGVFPYHEGGEAEWDMTRNLMRTVRVQRAIPYPVFHPYVLSDEVPDGLHEHSYTSAAVCRGSDRKEGMAFGYFIPHVFVS